MRRAAFASALGVVMAGVMPVATIGCGTLLGDPAVPMRLPDDDLAVGVSGAVIWDEREPPDQGDPLVGVDVGWIDGLWGLHAGLRVHGEGTRTRVGALVEATAWYGLLFGVGARVGWATTRDAGPAVDLTLLVGLPVPLLRDCAERGWTLVVVPYARPGFRLTGGDADPDDLRGVHELGVMVRWLTFGF